MKAKIILLAIVSSTLFFVAHIHATTITWGFRIDSIGWEDISDEFDMKYLPVGAYVSEIPMQTFVNEQGAAVVDVPLDLPDIGSGLKPDLALHYNSMHTGTMFGNDWTLSGLSKIHRVKKSIYYDQVTRGLEEDSLINGTEAFTLDDNHLIILSNDFPNTVTYQTETGRIKVKAHFIQRQDSLTKYQLRYAYRYFEVFYPNGKTAVFGFEDLEQNASLLQFPITKISDRLGQEVHYSYLYSYGEYRISTIEFGNNRIASIHFSYIKTGIVFRKQTILDEPRLLFFCFWGLDQPLILTSNLPTEMSTNCILDRIAIRYNNHQFRDYVFTYHSNGRYIFLSAIQMLKQKTNDSNASSAVPALRSLSANENENGIINDVACEENDSVDFVMPLRFRYGDNQSTSYEKTTTSLPYNKTIETKSQRGLFGNKQTSGIVISPRADSYSGLVCSASEIITARPDMNKAETYTLTAGAGFVDVLCLDIDGIQGDEVIKINNYIESVTDELGLVYPYDVVEYTVYTVNSSGAWTHKCTKKYYTAFEIDGNHPVYKEFFGGDFNGDGRKEIVAVSSLKPDARIPFAEMYDLTSDIPLYQGAIFADIQVTQLSTFANGQIQQVIDEIDRIRLITGDFNGNGKTGFFYLPRHNRYGARIEFDFNGTTLTPVKSSADIDIGVHNNKRYQTGDFNGDGRTDLLSTPYYLADADIVILFSDGDTFTFREMGLMESLSSSCRIATEDMNGDGESDVTVIKPNRTTTYFFSEGALMAYNYTMMDIPSDYGTVSGNYLGQEVKTNEVVFANGDSIVRLTYCIDLSKSLLLTGVRSGFNAVTCFEYSDLSNEAIYSAAGDTLFPYQTLSHSATVVSKMRTSHNDTPLEVKTYRYQNGIFHKQGLGFCGFEKITVLDSIRNQSTVTSFDPLQFGIVKQMESPATKLVKEYNVTVQPDKIAQITLAASVETAKLKNVPFNKSYVYDNFDNVTKETATYDNITRTTDNVYNNTETGELYLLGELTSSSVSSQTRTGLGGLKPLLIEAGGSVCPALKTTVLYDNRGLPVNKKTHYHGKLISEETGN